MRTLYIFMGYFDYSIKRLLMYRIYLIGELLSSLIVPILINFFLWRSLIERNPINYTLKEMMIYIIISNVILLFTEIHAEHDLEKDIKTYRFGQKLLLPVDYLTSISYSHISSSLAKFAILYMPIIIMISIWAKIEIPANRLLYLPAALILGFLLNALFSFIIGLLSFWLTEIWGIAAIRNLLTGLLSGAIFPLDLLPGKIESIMLMTPFPYMTYIPSKLICDANFDIEIVNKGLFISLVWVLILGFIVFLLMKNGLKKYTSHGA
ncbi:ABC transporter permease [Caldanaerobacter subterraneus]|uniref:ABC transporter permease n=1 Tax=Caldanaerobacter subterraneus TaxID=911092 RepID=A0A357VQJ6_9THEO|nr:ABC-2 family transporter protein [Caldanaerobacter subterraneus]TCO67580.1 ABC-2 type transport system permease protein [Caldanaerobacter subterraneus]HBT49921.1 ABC transporter permease [Caldanaerobacter subterraneus]